jgi:hypothetical protein
MNRRQFNRNLASAVVATAAESAVRALPLTQSEWWHRLPPMSPPSPQYLQTNLARYNPVWTSQGSSSLDSMPLSGAHGTGLNVWVQQDTVCFYIGRNDTYDEDGNLLKLGCVQIRLDPNPFVAAVAFEQKLDLYSSLIEIQARSSLGRICVMRLWLDVRHPNAVVEIESAENVAMEVSFLTWRDQLSHYRIENWNHADRHETVDQQQRVTPDHIEAGEEALLWYHQNDNARLVSEQMRREQDFSEPEDVVVDPSRDLIFGGMLRGSNVRFLKQGPVRWQQWEGRSWTYRSAQSCKRHLVTVCLAVEQTRSLGEWKQKLTERSIESMTELYCRHARQRAKAWWAEFWTRSYIFINPQCGPGDSGWQVGKNYQLFRYMLACNREGKLPLKFNGGIFNMDASLPQGYRIADGKTPAPAPPDYRRWSNLFMAQNQRLVGWPSVASGDDDLVVPSLDFYADRLNTAVQRSRRYWHHEGAVFVEPLSLYGLPVQALATATGPCSAKHLALHFSIMIEFAYMAIEWASYSGKKIARYLPLVESVVRFYDEHFRRECLWRTGAEYSADGRLVLFPMNCLELYTNAEDPIEVVSGLRRVVESILALPTGDVPAPMREYFMKLRLHLPLIPTEHRANRAVLSPAAKYDSASPMNRTEFPEMYAVWPYCLYGLGSRNGNDMAVNTWDTLPANRKPAMDFVSWQCTPVYAARMGKTEAAKDLIVEKLSDKNASLRFTAFFGPGHDWIPDHNWGGSGMVGLQNMLVAPSDAGLCLLPAWPREWDVEFQLHLPEQGVIRGSLKKKNLVQLTLLAANGRPYAGRVLLPPEETGKSRCQSAGNLVQNDCSVHE